MGPGTETGPSAQVSVSAVDYPNPSMLGSLSKPRIDCAAARSALIGEHCLADRVKGSLGLGVGYASAVPKTRVPRTATLRLRTECTWQRSLRVPAQGGKRAGPVECRYSLMFSPFFLEALGLPLGSSSGDWATRRLL